MKPGQDESIEHFQKDFLAPLLDKLIADGVVLSYSLDRQTIHTDDPNNFGLSVLANGAEGLDTFFAAVAQARKKDKSAGTAFDEAVDETRHRDVLANASFVRR
jgi:hypothetical protein